MPWSVDTVSVFPSQLTLLGQARPLAPALIFSISQCYPIVLKSSRLGWMTSGSALRIRESRRMIMILALPSSGVPCGPQRLCKWLQPQDKATATPSIYVVRRWNPKVLKMTRLGLWLYLCSSRCSPARAPHCTPCSSRRLVIVGALVSWAGILW
jgi:hypothetical protein